MRCAISCKVWIGRAGRPRIGGGTVIIGTAAASRGGGRRYLGGGETSSGGIAMHIFGRVWIVGDEIWIECSYFSLFLLGEMTSLCLVLLLILDLDGSDGSMEVTFASS